MLQGFHYVVMKNVKNPLQGYLREAKCHLALGDTASARSSLQTLDQLEPTNTAIAIEVCVFSARK